MNSINLYVPKNGIFYIELESTFDLIKNGVQVEDFGEKIEEPLFFISNFQCRGGRMNNHSEIRVLKLLKVVFQGFEI